MRIVCCFCNARLETGVAVGEPIRCATCRCILVVPKPREDRVPTALAPKPAGIFSALTRGGLECAWVQHLTKTPPGEAPKSFEQALKAYAELHPPVAISFRWSGLGALDAPVADRCFLCLPSNDLGLSPCPLCGSDRFAGAEGSQRLEAFERACKDRPLLGSQYLRERWSAVGDARLACVRGNRDLARRSLEQILNQIVGTRRSAALRAHAQYQLACVLFTPSMEPASSVRVRSLLYGSLIGAIRRDHVRLALAAYCILQGEWGEALHHLTTLPLTGPLTLGTLALLCISEIENGLASKALARCPEGSLPDPFAHLRARALLRLGREAEAAPLLRALLSRAPDNLALHCFLAVADPVGADEHVARAETSPIEDVRVRAQILRAWRRVKMGDTAAGQDLCSFREVSELNRPLLARALFQAGRQAQALELIGTDDLHLEWRAHFLLASGRPSESLSLYERLHQERPWNPEYLADLAYARAGASKFTEASATLEDAMRAGAADPRLRYFRALTFVRQAQPLKAIPLLRDLQSERPEDRSLALNLGILLHGQAADQFQRGRYEDAAENWEQSASFGFAPNTCSAHAAEARFRVQVRNLLDRKDCDGETLEALEHAADAFPGRAVYPYYLGLALLRAGRYDEARARFDQASSDERFRGRAAFHARLAQVAAGASVQDPAAPPGPRGTAQLEWLRALPRFRAEDWPSALRSLDDLAKSEVSADLFPWSLGQLPSLRARCRYRAQGDDVLEHPVEGATADGSADYMRGMLAAARGNTQEAIKYFRCAAPYGGGARDALRVLLFAQAASDLSNGRPDDAARVLEEAARDFPDDADLRRWRSAVQAEAVPRAKLKGPRPLDAFAVWDDVLPPLLRMLSQVEEKRSANESWKLDEGRQLRQVIVHSMAVASHRQAIVFEESRDFSAADRCWSRALNAWMALLRNGEVEQMLLASCERQFDEADPAIARDVATEFVMEVLLGPSFQYHRHYQTAGRSQRASLHLSFAEPLIRWMADRRPDDPSLRRMLAWLKFEQAIQAAKSRQTEEALSLLLAAIDLDPSIELFYFVGGMMMADLAVYAANCRKLLRADGLVRIALAFNPHDENVKRLAGQIEQGAREAVLSSGDPAYEEKAARIEERRRHIRVYCLREETLQDDTLRAIIDCVLRGMSDEETLSLLGEHEILERIPRQTLQTMLSEVQSKIEGESRP